MKPWGSLYYYIQAGSHRKKPAICIDLIIRFIFMVVPTAPQEGMDKQATYKHTTLNSSVMWTIIPLHMPPQGSTRTDTVAQSFPRVLDLLLLLIGLYGQLQGLKVCESCTEAAAMQYR